MSEVNGREANVGDRILVASQVARITSIDTVADRIEYIIQDGQGTNRVSNHVSNTPFEVIDPVDGHIGLAGRQAADLEAHASDVHTIADPVEEDPNTDRVKGAPGAKLAGQPDATHTDEITTLGGGE